MPDINDVRVGEAAISKDTLNFKDWMMQRPNKNDNLDILKSLQSYAAYLEEKNPRISSLNNDEQLYALRKVMSIGFSAKEMESLLPKSKVPSNLEQLFELTGALNAVSEAVWKNTSFADLKAGRISDEGTMAAYMAKLVNVEKAAQNAPAKEATPKAAAQPSRSQKDSVKQSMQADGRIAKIQGWLNQVKLPKEMATQLCEKYGVDAAYKIVQQSMLAPKTAMEAMGEGYKNSKGAIEYFANLDDAKGKTVDIEKLTGAEKTKPDELYGARPATNSAETDAPAWSVSLDEVVITAQAPKNNKPFFRIPTTEKPDLSQMKITPIKTPAEQKYDELLAKKRKRSGDENAYLTCGDLLDAGVDVKKDFKTALSLLAVNHTDFPKELYAAFPDRDAAISKDVATAALTVMNARKTDKNLYAQFKDMAKEAHNNKTNDSEQLRMDLQRQEELALAQGRIKGHIPTDNESDARFDAAAARKDKHPAQPVIDVALVAHKDKQR